MSDLEVQGDNTTVADASTPNLARPLPSHYYDLDAVLDAAFGYLKTGAANRRSGFHTVTVASIRADGTPNIRTVVLRRFSREAREIAFHIDSRSPKYSEIQREPRIAALFYDPQHKIQMRLTCVASIHQRNDLSRASWERSRAMSRLCYGQARGPGALLSESGAVPEPPLPEEIAYENFAVVTAKITSLDWLYLAVQGHRRAIFNWDGDAMSKSWVAP